MSKPDGNEGWATFFVDKGFTVYVIDLPACGRSNELDGQALDWKKLATETASMSKNFIEKELTAIGNSGPVRWLAAARHSQWPGVSTWVQFRFVEFRTNCDIDRQTRRQGL